MKEGKIENTRDEVTAILWWRKKSCGRRRRPGRRMITGGTSGRDHDER